MQSVAEPKNNVRAVGLSDRAWSLGLRALFNLVVLPVGRWQRARGRLRIPLQPDPDAQTYWVDRSKIVDPVRILRRQD